MTTYPRGDCQQCYLEFAVYPTTGNIVRHLDPHTAGQEYPGAPAQVCNGSLMPPRPTLRHETVTVPRFRRGVCLACYREIAYRVTTRLLVPHNNSNGDECEGTGQPVAPDDNMAPFGAASGGGWLLTDGDKPRQDESELAMWWRRLGESDIARMAPKAHEYSAYDLVLIGRSLGDMVGQSDLINNGWGDSGFGDAAAAEIACWVYILGKVGRAIGAIKEGRLPSEDTAEDVRIYATMVARIKDVGAWPGKN